ncbi:hypothetical protein PG999_000295 [Apiospora kogelbergensis]|uniref:NACHT domain-containing protein n=1 Tax=Apiospora kogelbergensis TaxID=1337665 RepID=A0AAW0RB25_9PEZI
MDPVTALGVISSAIAIVDGVAKTLGLAWEIYNSVEGSSEETNFRLQLSERVRDVSQQLIPTDQLAICEEDRGLVSLARECNQLSRDITKELEKLKPKRRKSAWQSALAALRTARSKRKIENLEKHLSECHNQLHFQISHVSRQDLKALLASNNENGAKLTKLDQTLNTLQNTLQNVNETNARWFDPEALAQIRYFLDIGYEAMCEVIQDRVLRGVQGGFAELHYRYQTVERPFGNTFEWIFDFGKSNPEAAKFTDWLSSGGGIFHICGKPGSGKSTLMKKLFGHGITRTEVEKWAHANGDRKLVMANFFFYALGKDSRQKSLAGLVRTLVYHILEQRPLLTKEIFPARWVKALSESEVRSALVIGDDEIEIAFDRLTQPRENEILSQHCFCFFIDGLDEYQVTTSADRGDLVNKLLRLTNNQPKTFKVCVSSREENPFMDMVSQNNRFRLHKLTISDMRHYVDGRLTDTVSPQERQKLVSVITSKAEGVFLWVALVVQGIRQLAADGAGFSSLLRETESLPNDLNELFGRILATVNPGDRVHFNDVVGILRFIETLVTEENEFNSSLYLGLDDFYFLDDYEEDHHFAQNVHFTNREFLSLHEARSLAKRRLRGVCRGLVETIDQEDDGAPSRLNFIHRSVSDFLRSEKSWEAISNDPSDALDALSQLKLASLTQIWWKAGFEIPGTIHNWEIDQGGIEGQSAMIDSLIEERHKLHLDGPRLHSLVL